MSDIDDLIAAASDEQRSRHLKIQSQRQVPQRNTNGKRTLSGWLALVVLVVALGYIVVQVFMPVSQADIRTDLNTALDAAHDTVEAYRRVNGRLPERIPAAALANLVHFEQRNGGYRLSASLNDMSLSREY